MVKKLFFLGLLLVIILVVGCVKEKVVSSKEAGKASIEEKQSKHETEQEQAIEEGEGITKEEVKKEESEEEIPEEVEEERIVKEEEIKSEEKVIEQEELENVTISEEIQNIFERSKTRIKSYFYQYISPSGKQYYIYVKGSRIVINPIPTPNKIYLDKEKKKAEEYCVIYSKCMRHFGKIADLDYDEAYIETPIDWLEKITEARKLNEEIYNGRRSWKLETNIGVVIIDTHYGFIYKIKQDDKVYSFINVAFNTEKDCDVTVPEYLSSD